MGTPNSLTAQQHNRPRAHVSHEFQRIAILLAQDPFEAVPEKAAMSSVPGIVAQSVTGQKRVMTVEMGTGPVRVRK